MSRSTGDRSSQQQPQQHNQNQQIIQPIQQQQQNLQAIRNPPTPQQQQPVLTLPPSGSQIIIINSSNNSSLNASEGILRTPVNTLQNSIYYPTSPSSASGATSTINANLIAQHSTPTTSHLDQTSPIAKKRLKLEIADNSSSCGATNTTEDLAALKQRILDIKRLRLKGLKER
jgi:hypothetical protein